MSVHATKTNLIHYLKENQSVALSVAKELWYTTGSETVDFVDIYDLEDLCNITENTYELVRAVIYGNVRNINTYVRYNGYGNLESVDIIDLETDAAQYASDYIDEVIDLYECKRITINDLEFKELLDDYLEGLCEEGEEED